MASGPFHATFEARVADPPTGDAALQAVAEERERLRRWAAADDAQRNVVEAIVHASLSRLLRDPAWIPGSARLDGRQLRIAIVVELDATQAGLSSAAADLEASSLAAREALAALMGRLEAMAAEA